MNIPVSYKHCIASEIVAMGFFRLVWNFSMRLQVWFSLTYLCVHFPFMKPQSLFVDWVVPRNCHHWAPSPGSSWFLLNTSERQWNAPQCTTTQLYKCQPFKNYTFPSVIYCSYPSLQAKAKYGRRRVKKSSHFLQPPPNKIGHNSSHSSIFASCFPSLGSCSCPSL